MEDGSKDFVKKVMTNRPLEDFAPPFQPDQYSERDREHLAPFFTNLDKSVYVPLVLAPELIGALCSRTSRASQDLRYIYLNEFIYPFVNPERDEKDTDETWQEKIKYGEALKKYIEFLHEHSTLELFSNPRARSFYIKWLAQYGDDSIAQMAGAHLVFTGLSQVAIKHFEDQRIGLAPIEKSTRYVNYSQKINGRYLYYTDPSLKEFGLETEYCQMMDKLFATYTELIPKLNEWLLKKFPQEKPAVVEKKVFDTLRGLLPTSTLSQVAFFGNGQAFEYMISRSAKHQLGEIRWAAQRAFEELNQVTPSFLKRIEKETAQEYQAYLANKGVKTTPLVEEFIGRKPLSTMGEPEVRLIEYDPDGEEKIITAILFSAPANHTSWNEILERVRRMSGEDKKRVLAQYLSGRTQRWQKVGRAFENVYIRFEIVMDIGAWRDLHRHRMLTQMRQDFSCYHGYNIPPEIKEASLEQKFKNALDPIEELYIKIKRHDPWLAQYAVTLAHRIRFMQWENLRQSFWQTELRTIPEGHPDYRKIEQQKFQWIKKAYPLIAEFMLVNMGEYDFARRGQEEKIQSKIQRLI